MRGMKRYLTDKYWMMGSMDFWINGSSVTSVTLDSIGGKRESREDCEVWNSQLLSPKFRLLASARFKPVLKGFKPIYTIQGTLFLSHAERQGLSSEAPGPAASPVLRSPCPAVAPCRRGIARSGKAPTKEDWRFRVSAARVFAAGAPPDTAPDKRRRLMSTERGCGKAQPQCSLCFHRLACASNVLRLVC